MGDLQAAIAGDRFDVAKAQARIDARAEAMRKDSAPVLAAAATFFDSLKPEQQAQVREMLAKGPMMGGHGMGHGKGPMHGGMH
jgi:Tfp pilus assembly protein FimV